MSDQPQAFEAGVSRRAFVVQVGAVAALLGAGFPARAQTAIPVPGKEKLIVRSSRAVILETPLRELTTDITPNDLFFVRNNYDAAVIDPATYALTIDGEVESPLTLRLDDLRRLPQITQTVTLECAGNGRSFHKPPVTGTPWEHGAVGTALWRGVRLADVLQLAQPRPAARHVIADGYDMPPTPETPDFIRSHPIDKAIEPHTMIALEMNGEPLPHLHGGPARLLVPGWVGSASIKWLAKLTLAGEEWDGPFMARSYRSPRDDDPSQTYSLQSVECKSIIVSPGDGAALAAGPQKVTGFAWAGEGTVVAVDVSTDGGETWRRASLVGTESRYAWRRFELGWTAAPGARTVMARASDSLGRRQPASRPRDPQGYRWNVIHAVRVNVT